MSFSSIARLLYQYRVAYLLTFSGLNALLFTSKSIAMDTTVNSPIHTSSTTNKSTGLIIKEGWNSKTTAPIGTGVIVDIKPNKNSSEVENNGEYFKYKYIIVTALHVIHRGTSRKKENASFYLNINNDRSRVTCIHKSSIPDLDIAVLEVSSNKEYIPIKIDSELFQYQENINISGWNLTTIPPEFEVIKTTITDKSKDSLTYHSSSITFDGMSGGAITNLNGKLIGIHRGKFIGIPIAQAQKVIDEFKKAPKCECSTSFIGGCEY